MGTFAEVEDLPIVYLNLSGVLSNKITRGDVTMIVGPGGASKGQIGISIATDLSHQGLKTVMITPEDDIETTVGPRLTAAGADKSKVFNLTTLDSGAPFLLHADGKTPGCIGALRALVDSEDIRCVIIDPILSCLGNGSIASNKGARALLAPLFAMAKETGIAILLTHHTVLGPDGKPKPAGSKGLTDALRLVYMAKGDDYNPAIRVLSTFKTNGKPTDDVQYTLKLAANGFTFVSWLDNDEMILRRTKWRMQAEEAGKKLGQVTTTASGDEVGAVPCPPVVAAQWSSDESDDEAEELSPEQLAMNERVEAMTRRYITK